MNHWTETHAHIYSRQFSGDLDQVLDRARTAGVGPIYMPNIDVDSIDQMLSVEQRFEDCIPMMGLHPCYVKEDFEKQLSVMESWLHKRKFAAIGEIGTDLYWDKAFWPQQQEAFRIQIEWSLKFGLPAVIHCRSSIDETIDLLEPFRGNGLRGVFHCFSGTKQQLGQVINLGFHIGVGGVATFKNGGLDSVLPGMNPERLLLETDSPYLAPVPHRGKRNEPAFIAIVAARVAEILGMSQEELSKCTSANARALFGE